MLKGKKTMLYNMFSNNNTRYNQVNPRRSACATWNNRGAFLRRKGYEWQTYWTNERQRNWTRKLQP